MQNTALMEMEGLLNKIRKRGYSTPSSSSSRVRSHRFKKGILLGKKARGGIGLGGSRSSTPVPSWKLTPSRTVAVDSPKYSQKSNGGSRSQSVSARKLAATLWGMNELPTPKLSENLLEEKKSKRQHQKEKSNPNFPPRLSDPNHSPISERMDKSATCSYQRRSLSISQRIPSTGNSARVYDSRSIGNLMEIETTKSRAQTPNRSGASNQLKDISNALTTSKELLKIINRIWAKADQPSANLSLISALQSELERARLNVNQLIQEQKSNQHEVNFLLKRFSEEKAAWRKKECQAIEAAIENIANELEVEKKLRRRIESLNKKIGKELSESKTSVLKFEKELEREKRAREILEQVCEELAKDSGEDKALVEELKKDADKVREEVEKEREMLHVADMLREERVQMKLLEAKQQFEEKNSAVDKLRKQLETFLGKAGKEKKIFNNNTLEDDGSDDTGEVEDVIDGGEDTAESEMHSIELNMDKFRHRSSNGDDEAKWRKSIAGQMARRCCLPQRSSSDGVEWGVRDRSIVNRAENLLGEKTSELEKQAQRNSSADEMQRNKAVKDLRNNALMSTSRIGTGRDFLSPNRKLDQPWSQGTNRKSRLADSLVEEDPSAKARRSKR